MTGAALAARGCWLFDLDGTLVDSTPAHEAAYRTALGELFPAALGSFRYAEHLGRPTAEVVAGLGVADPVLAGRLVARKQARYRECVAAGRVLPLPGGPELLTELARRGRPRYVVTGASRASAERVLAATGLAGLVGGLVTAEDAAPGKPHPAAYREACRRYAPGGDPGTAVAVEDSAQGVASALAAGLLTVHVRAGGPAVPGPGVVPVAGLEALRALLDGAGR